jgi:hypothetical protein
VRGAKALLSLGAIVRIATIRPRLAVLLGLLAAAGCPEPADRWEIHAEAEGPPITLQGPNDQAQFDVILKVSRRAFPLEGNGRMRLAVTVSVVDGEGFDVSLVAAGVNEIRRSVRGAGASASFEAVLQISCDERECMGRARQAVAGAGTMSWRVAGVFDAGLVRVGEQPPQSETLGIEIVAVEQ